MLLKKKSTKTDNLDGTSEKTRFVEVETSTGRYRATVFSDLASTLKPAERLMSSWILVVIATAAITMSIRHAVDFINKVLFRKESGSLLKMKTIADRIIAMGNKIKEERRKEANEILASKDIDDEKIDTAIKSIDADTSPENINMNPSSNDTKIEVSADGIKKVTPVLPLLCPKQSKNNKFVNWLTDLANAYNEEKPSEYKIKDPLLVSDVELDTEHTVYVCIDEVGVKHQTDHRPEQEGGKERERVENTVIHVRSGGNSYLITSTDMKEAYRQLTAYIIINGLNNGNYQFLFFSDGARNIQHYVKAFYGNVPIVLDWYHLDLHLKQTLSMAIKADKTRKNEIHDRLCGMLWAGNFDDAAEYLKSLPASEIKNSNQLDAALQYLSRKSSLRACYALRHLLGYQNSSNRVEGANNILVANRQKHQSMSWSFPGSGALAAITCAQQNGELEEWLTHSHLSFKRPEAA